MDTVAVTNRKSLVEFVRQLSKDFLKNPEEWNNITVSDYLEALAAFIDDSDGYYQNKGLPIPELPNWQTLAEFLVAAKYYE